MKCNLALCPRLEQLMLRSSSEGSKKNITLKEKRCMFVDLEKAIDTVLRKVLGNENEMKLK